MFALPPWRLPPLGLPLCQVGSPAEAWSYSKLGSYSYLSNSFSSRYSSLSNPTNINTRPDKIIASPRPREISDKI